MRKGQLSDAAHALCAVFNNYGPTKTTEQVHKYNLQSACVKFLNKHKTSRDHKREKILSLSINVNEIISIEYILNQTQASANMDMYTWTTFNEIITAIKKQIEHDYTIEDNVLFKFR